MIWNLIMMILNLIFCEKKKNRGEEQEDQDKKIYMMKTNSTEINNKVKEKIFKLEKMIKKLNDKKCGRKKKEELKNGAHNKNCEDNIINKIKTHFFSYLYEIINENVENKKYKIKKIPTKVISNLNVIDNEEMWNNTISDILKSNKISTKYSTYDEWENKNIVEKIEKNKKEMKVKKILNLKFKELFGIFRRKLNNNKEIENELIEKINELGREDLGDATKENIHVQGVTFLGDGVPIYEDIIWKEINVPCKFAPASMNRQRAASVAAYGTTLFKEGKFVDADDFAPEYLRKSQAERVAESKGE